MVDERRRSKPMKAKKYGEIRVFIPFTSSSLYLHFHPFASLSFCIFVGLFFEPSKMGIV